MQNTIKVTIWNEFLRERTHEATKEVYPDGIHNAINGFLAKQPDMEVKTATLDQPENGLTEEVLNNTDVLIWWGHKAHKEVDDEIVTRIQKRVLEGMGLIVLHSGHFSKIFKRMLGTNCSLRWREIGEKERLWNLQPGHPITRGIGDYFELPNTEMYGERFDIPDPDELIFVSWFEGGEVFRSGCCWQRGHGKIFYFRPGHETYPIFYNEDVQTVITNAIRWARSHIQIPDVCNKVEPLENIQKQMI